MVFEDIVEPLLREGWIRHDDDAIGSPSGLFFVDREKLATDICTIYEWAAHRALASGPTLESHREWLGTPREAHELAPLLRLLERDPAVDVLLRHFEHLRSEIAAFASDHAMTVSLWQHPGASIRATARHPSGGIVTIVCRATAAPSFALHAAHWIDDFLQGSRSFRLREFFGLNLAELLPDVLAFLQASPEHAPFEHAQYGGGMDEPEVAKELAYWGKFSVLG